MALSLKLEKDVKMDKNRYSLIQEHEKHYQIHDKSDNSHFSIAKKDIHPATQLKVLKLQKFSDGGEAEDLGMADKNIPKKDAVVAKDDSSGDYDKRPWYANYVDTTPDTPVAAIPKVPQADMSGYTPPSQDVPLQDTSPTPSAPAQAQPSAAPSAPVPGAMPTGAATPQGLSALEAQYGKSVNQEAQGQIAQNKAQAGAMDEYLKNEQARQQVVQAHMQKYQQQADELSQNIASNKIDPNKYWNDKSTGGKVSTALGVLLAGIGQGLSHSTSNMAWTSLQKNIDRDIESQKDDLGKKQSLLSDNLRIQGNLQSAEAATRLQTNAMLQGQMIKIANQTNDPIIQARAQQKLIEMKHNDLPLQQQLAQTQISTQIRNQLMKGNVQGHDPASYVPYVVPEQRQKEVFDEIKNAQDIKALSPKIMAASQMASSKNPVVAAQGQREFEGLMNTTVKEQEGTARQAAFDSIHKNMTPNGITALPGENEAKTRTTLEYLASKASAPTAKGFGIDLGKFESTAPSVDHNTKLLNYAKAHPNDPNSQMILKKLGPQ